MAIYLYGKVLELVCECCHFGELAQLFADFGH